MLNVFAQEVNDAAKNDQMETVDPEVMRGLAEMGAFGMQVHLMEATNTIHYFVLLC